MSFNGIIFLSPISAGEGLCSVLQLCAGRSSKDDDLLSVCLDDKGQLSETGTLNCTSLMCSDWPVGTQNLVWFRLYCCDRIHVFEERRVWSPPKSASVLFMQTPVTSSCCIPPCSACLMKLSTFLWGEKKKRKMVVKRGGRRHELSVSMQLCSTTSSPTGHCHVLRALMIILPFCATVILGCVLCENRSGQF